MNLMISIIVIGAMIYVIVKILKLRRDKSFLDSSEPFALFGFDPNLGCGCGMRKLRLKGKDEDEEVCAYNSHVTDVSFLIEDVQAKAREMARND